MSPILCIRLRLRATVHAHRTARVGKILVMGWGKRGHLSMDGKSRIENGAIIRIGNGGRVTLGKNVVVRSGAVLNVNGGHLDIRDDVIISWHSVVHCGQHVVLEEKVVLAEGVTVVDSAHFHGPEGASNEYFYDNGKSAPVLIGRSSWLAAKSTVASGATLGPRTTVAAHAVVRAGTYPKDATLVGIPARVLDR